MKLLLWITFRALAVVRCKEIPFEKVGKGIYLNHMKFGTVKGSKLDLIMTRF